MKTNMRVTTKNRRIQWSLVCLIIFSLAIFSGFEMIGFSNMTEQSAADTSDALSIEMLRTELKENQEPVTFEIFISLEEALVKMKKSHTLKLSQMSSPAKGVYELGNMKLLEWKYPVVTYQGKLGMWVARDYEGDMGWLMVEDVKGVSLYSMKKPSVTTGEIALTWTGEKYALSKVPKAYTHILVNKDYSYDSEIDFKKTTLQKLGISGRATMEVNEEIGIELQTLFKEAKKKANHSLLFTSGYRSVGLQRAIIDREVQLLTNRGVKDPLTEARKTINLPGQSEHHTGYAVDILSSKALTLDAFYGTPAATWLNDNASTYGFVVRYPENKTPITGISYEPWHLRYLGKGLAKHLTQKKWTLEEWVVASKKGTLYEADDKKMKYYKVLDLKRGGTAWVTKADLTQIKIYYITKDLIGLEFDITAQ